MILYIVSLFSSIVYGCNNKSCIGAFIILSRKLGIGPCRSFVHSL